MKSTNATFYRSGLKAILLTGLVYVAMPGISQAQIVDPLREYTNPDEIVTFNRSTTYAEAIEIINTFALEYENRFIVDNSTYSGELGVNLPPMHWKDALQYIMRFQDLELTEYEDYYEINVPQPEPVSGTDVQTTGTATGGQGQGQPSGINTGTREVRINATFFEGNKRALQEIGIDWSTLTSDVPAAIGEFVSGIGGRTVPATDFTDPFVSINSFNAANVSQNAFNAVVNFDEIGPGISVQALFSAFEADNLGKVLATPSIKVVDGEEGDIQVGQDFSIKQRDIAGNVTDNFVSTGTILTVTPQIITEGDTSFIYLSLAVERSTVQPDVVSTIINKQSAETSAILMNGESTYVAGLYRTEETSIRRGVPILKDLPGWFFGLRYIFGFNSKDFLENELIIIVQAELVQPVSERFANRRLSQRELLNKTRDEMRTNLDRVFTTEDAALITQEPQEEMGADTSEIVAEPDTVEFQQPITAQEEEEELTDDQKELAEELSMPVEHPELMVVVPKAFDLDEFLMYQESGDEIQTDEETSDLRYFVIGGSFLVPRNAQNFKNMLEEQGYDTRILFNPETRFNYVAYKGFSNFDQAVQRTLEIRNSFNNEAWLFTLQSETQEISN